MWIHERVKGCAMIEKETFLHTWAEIESDQRQADLELGGLSGYRRARVQGGFWERSTMEDGEGTMQRRLQQGSRGFTCDKAQLNRY